MFSADVFNTKLVPNLPTELLSKFGNFRLSSVSSELILLALWSLKNFGQTAKENSKDKTFLGSDLARGLTRKVVHKNLRNVPVNFENFF